MINKLKNNIELLLERIEDFGNVKEDKKVFFPALDKALSCGMQVDKEEVKEISRFANPVQKVATCERGTQINPELTHYNLLQLNPSEFSGVFKVPKSKKKQRAKEKQDDPITKPRKRIFHEANYSDLDRYDFGVFFIKYPTKI